MHLQNNPLQNNPLQNHPPLRVSPWNVPWVGVREMRAMPIQTIIPASSAIGPFLLSLLGGGTVIGLLAAVQKYFEWSGASKQARMEKAKLDAASVQIAHIEQEGQESKKVERMIDILLNERKGEVICLKGELAEMKTDMTAQRREFDAKIVSLVEGQKEEAEARQMVKLSADAAHLRADEAVKKLALAKAERDELTRKLLLVEARAGKAEERTEQVEKEKNIAVHLLADQLDAANKKIAGLEEYIKAQKLTLKLEQGGQTVTASLDPIPLLPVAAEDGD